MAEGRGALERGPAGGLPAGPLVAHRGGHQVEGILEGPPHSAHPLVHVGLGHSEFVSQVIHGAGRRGGEGGERGRKAIEMQGSSPLSLLAAHGSSGLAGEKSQQPSSAKPRVNQHC